MKRKEPTICRVCGAYVFNRRCRCTIEMDKIEEDLDRREFFNDLDINHDFEDEEC